MLRVFLGFLVCLVFAALTIAPVLPRFWLRNSLGDLATRMEAYDVADFLYTTTAMQGLRGAKRTPLYWTIS